MYQFSPKVHAFLVHAWSLPCTNSLKMNEKIGTCLHMSEISSTFAENFERET